MSDDVLNIILKRFDSIEEQLEELKRYKNMAIGWTIGAASVASVVFSALMKFFQKGKNMEKKKPWESRQMIFGAVAALLPFIPGASNWFSSHQQVVLPVFGLATMLLRIISKGKISIGD